MIEAVVQGVAERVARVVLGLVGVCLVAGAALGAYVVLVVQAAR